MINKITFPKSKITIEKESCYCLKLRLFDKVSNQYFNVTNTLSDSSITHNKAFNLAMHENTIVKDFESHIVIETDFIEYIIKA